MSEIEMCFGEISSMTKALMFSYVEKTRLKRFCTIGVLQEALKFLTFQLTTTTTIVHDRLLPIVLRTWKSYLSPTVLSRSTQQPKQFPVLPLVWQQPRYLPWSLRLRQQLEKSPQIRSEQPVHQDIDLDDNTPPNQQLSVRQRNP